jgi:FkbM family methyltransferase
MTVERAGRFPFVSDPVMLIYMSSNFLDIFRNAIRVSGLDGALSGLTKGQYATSVAAKIVPQFYQYPKGQERRVKREGLEFVVDPSDYIEWHLFFGIRDHNADFLFDRCKPGYTVLDIGTNIGYFALKMAQRVGSSGRVFGFEPHPFIFNKASRNLELSKMENVEIARIGLGSKSGWASMETPVEANRGQTHITSMDDSGESEIRLLDDWVQGKQIEKIDLIKIDVEGFEYDVLSGGLRTLAEMRPLMFIELSDPHLSRFGHSSKKLLGLLAELGYSFVDVSSGEAVTVNSDLVGKHIDIWCTP